MLQDLSFTREGKQRLTLELDGDFRESFDKLKDKPVEVEVKRWRKRRSLDANAYFWVLCGKLAEALSQPKAPVSREAVYREAIRNIGGNCETVCVLEAAAEKLRQGWEHNGLGWVTDTIPSKLPGCVNVLLYYGSSTYDTAQMSRLIDNIVQDCRAVGVETLTRSEPGRLKGYDAQYFTR